MVDGAYQDIVEALKPGVRENEIVALATKRLYEIGSDDVEAINAVSGRALQPASAQLLRPPDPAGRPGVLRHHPVVQRLSHVLLPHVQRRLRDAVAARCLQEGRDWIDAAIELIRPGVTTDQVARAVAEGRRVRVLETRWKRSGCSSATASGSRLHERPIISRLNSLEHPMEIKEGMVFALETYCPATDGFSAARIEEEIVVTADGARR